MPLDRQALTSLDGSNEDGDIVSFEDLHDTLKLEELLRMPFDDALRRCVGLRQHISAQGTDAQSVEDEFRNHWGPSAPLLLRSVLSEVAGLGTASQRYQLLGNDDTWTISDLDQVFGNHDGQRVGQGESLEAMEKAKMRITKLTAFLNSPQLSTIEWGGWLPGERTVAPATTPEALLELPFGEALMSSRALRRYIDDQDDPDAVEREFSNDWGPDAPAALRDVLAQVLSLELIEPEVPANSEKIGSTVHQRPLNAQSRL